MIRSGFETKRGRRKTAAPAHDPEETARAGMSPEGAAEDEAETMASTGDSAGSFVEIASGTATGLGLDRGESIGTGGLAAGEDLDEVAAGDYWREYFERNPFRDPESPYYQCEPGECLGWEKAAGLDPSEEGLPELDHPIFPPDEKQEK
jgi:hypothetical protein